MRRVWISILVLTPKRPNIRTADQPVLVSVTGAHTIFIFLKLLVKMRLPISFVEKKIVLFGPGESKVMGI
jgi:hypothetical protein